MLILHSLNQAVGLLTAYTPGKQGCLWKEDQAIKDLALPDNTLLLQLTAPLDQPTVDDPGHQDVPCYLMALDGGTLERENTVGSPLLLSLTISWWLSLVDKAQAFQARTFAATREKGVASHPADCQSHQAIKKVRPDNLGLQCLSPTTHA